ncbi:MULTISPECIES: 2Fe-2S iron-sulfur cluster-binding protein [Paracoccus]|uniref:2Fe-2S iron-sulfur cluster-binding protein n=1 Tax=Paracoccus TaxID=265 RepID=UPI001FB70835|nr:MULTISPECIES: 2Fe-2S iron-sulfur cluster-binding protein [Paracoccus]MCJ1901802.1 2Fe-2S iron-sulfur cluster-binding protein [Paracoccus versutus]MDF3906649.1 2Fe-2S iron-sulfur cluster-binding protein [Paracoccus sp. AS002]
MEVSVWRGSGGPGRRGNQTVLDVVSGIQRTVDPSLTCRSACRLGMCGMVDGRPHRTCRTHAKRVLADGGLQVRCGTCR